MMNQSIFIGSSRTDGDDPVSVLLQGGGRAIAISPSIWGKTDYGDGFDFIDNSLKFAGIHLQHGRPHVMAFAT